MNATSVVLQAGKRVSKSKVGRKVFFFLFFPLAVPILLIPVFFLLPFLSLVDNSTSVGIESGGAAYVVPEEIEYQEIDPEFIISWLQERNSALATIEFANACIAAGKKYNINPLLLIAIYSAPRCQDTFSKRIS